MLVERLGDGRVEPPPAGGEPLGYVGPGLVEARVGPDLGHMTPPSRSGIRTRSRIASATARAISGGTARPMGSHRWAYVPVRVKSGANDARTRSSPSVSRRGLAPSRVHRFGRPRLPARADPFAHRSTIRLAPVSGSASTS